MNSRLSEKESFYVLAKCHSVLWNSFIEVSGDDVAQSAIAQALNKIASLANERKAESYNLSLLGDPLERPWSKP